MENKGEGTARPGGRRGIRRVEVFLSRIEGEYPKLTFRIGGRPVPFFRGRLLLEGDMRAAERVDVSAPEGSEYVPLLTTVDIIGDRVTVELVTAEELERRLAGELSTSAVVGEDSAVEPDAGDGEDFDGYEEYGGYEDYPETDKERDKGSRKKILWALLAACIIAVGILIWGLLRAGSPSAAATDSDSVKADTTAVADSIKQDTAKAAKPEEPSAATSIAGGYTPSYSSPMNYNAEADTTPAETPRVRKPAYENYTTEGEH